MSNIQYPAARAHPTIHACPQFRPVRRGGRDKGLTRTYTCSNGDTLYVHLFEQVDIADQDLLLALLAIARSIDRGVMLNPKPDADADATNAKLINGLTLDGYAATQPAIKIDISVNDLLRETGRTTGKNDKKWLKSSLIRLSQISFRRQGKSEWSFFTFNLLSLSSLPDFTSTAQLSIAINPLSARALIGNDDGYVLVHRAERAQLSSAVAKGLHAALCGLVNRDGLTRTLNVDKLADRVYARYDDEISAGTIRDRRNDIISASALINKLNGWTISRIGKSSSASLVIARSKDLEQG